MTIDEARKNIGAWVRAKSPNGPGGRGVGLSPARIVAVNGTRVEIQPSGHKGTVLREPAELTLWAARNATSPSVPPSVREAANAKAAKIDKPSGGEGASAASPPALQDKPGERLAVKAETPSAPVAPAAETPVDDLSKAIAEFARLREQSEQWDALCASLADELRMARECQAQAGDELSAARSALKMRIGL